MNELDDCILFLLAKAYQRVYGNFKKRLQPYGLTPVQHLVLLSLSLDEGISPGELGRRLILDNATLSGILDRLVDSEWIVKQSSNEDKRSLKLYLTEKGRDGIEVLKRESDDANSRVLDILGMEERILLKRFLKDLQQ
ncbi:MAG: MarR family transcriptional regulator [delta proteobacterium MLS_D]|nr:MAG: MarR family transcriptional regulator [delta proteobacterium MLS_D]